LIDAVHGMCCGIIKLFSPAASHLTLVFSNTEAYELTCIEQVTATFRSICYSPDHLPAFNSHPLKRIFVRKTWFF